MKKIILTILLSLFLLVSLGFVSASEIDDGSTTVLNEIESDSITEIDLDSISQVEASDADSISQVEHTKTDAVSTGQVEIVKTESAPITKTLDGGSFDDIQSAIDEMKDGDTLDLKGTFKSNGKPINVTKSITIKSSSKATLDGNVFSSIFDLSGKSIALNGLNLINSYSDISPAVYCHYEGSGNAKHSFLNCNFENNYGEYGGSCILTGENVQPDITGCTFKGNNANEGSTIHSNSRNMVIKKCTFIGNYASTGGAIHSSAPGLSIVNSIFKDNRADTGGCIYSESTFSIKDSTFSNNKASSGLAIYSEASFSIANSKFINHKASGEGIIKSRAPLTVSKSHFENNSREIIDSSAKVTVTDSKFVNNKGLIIISNGKITVKNSYFSNNKNTLISGPSYVVNSKFYKNAGDLIMGKTYVINSVFKSNKGGHCIWAEGKSTVKKCSFTSNTAYSGAAIYGKGLVVSYCNFTKNKATGKNSCGGAIDGRGVLKINNCRFVRNSAKHIAGAISCSKKAIITKCTFLNNRASSIGAVSSVNLVAKNCVFKNNRGGAIEALKKLTASKCTFIKNKYNYQGGAIYVSYGTVKNCVFTKNSAKKAGGAIYVLKKCNVYNSKFTRNSVKYYGSAIALFLKCTVKAKKCKFTKNSKGKGKNPFAWPFRTYGKGTVVCIGKEAKFTAVKCKGLSMAVKKHSL